MARLEIVQFLAVIVIIVQHLTHLVECEDKRIVIFMPRRIKTIHHHHHHVVLMDPKTKTMTHTKPYSDRSSSSVSSSSAEVDYQQQRDHHRHYQRQRQQQKQKQQQQQQQQQQSEEAESHPLSYFQQRTTIRTSDPNTLYPISRPQPSQTYYSTLPSRQKRSKVIARLVYNH
ncbi:oxidant-induced cell-cycle arrest protein 5-like [Rhopalosiphum maidis]|uniref:oxidant-induced cell-cycle arrest protein 5-like n=1 Tax=Rhopalosiphum maidis TaxID=43146 RepID=UPI000EFE4C5B|nr:oxidant-induced cell-cycle arrest protein 5-like [Rhopalosiphum maidis]